MPVRVRVFQNLQNIRHLLPDQPAEFVQPFLHQDEAAVLAVHAGSGVAPGFQNPFQTVSGDGLFGKIADTAAKLDGVQIPLRFQAEGLRIVFLHVGHIVLRDGDGVLRTDGDAVAAEDTVFYRPGFAVRDLDRPAGAVLLTGFTADAFLDVDLNHDDFPLGYFYKMSAVCGQSG